MHIKYLLEDSSCFSNVNLIFCIPCLLFSFVYSILFKEVAFWWTWCFITTLTFATRVYVVCLYTPQFRIVRHNFPIDITRASVAYFDHIYVKYLVQCMILIEALSYQMQENPPMFFWTDLKNGGLY